MNTACYRHCCVNVTGLQRLGLLSSNDLSTSLSDQCIAFLGTHLLERWSGGNVTMQTSVQTRQLRQELLQGEPGGCLQSSFTQRAGRMHPWPLTDHAAAQFFLALPTVAEDFDQMIQICCKSFPAAGL